MKLWRRRPLSVDLTDKSLGVSNEMPPSLVYISPGMHCVSKRSSLINNESVSKPQFFSDVSSFNSTDKCVVNNKSNEVETCPLQSFKDYVNNSSVSFEDGTLRSTRLTNKSYISPVSSEWFPVKDVMKIKRSASVPFHAPQNAAPISQSIIESKTVSVKSHTSLADKIRTLFRTRSSSRSSKPALASITECKTNKGKICLRNSRTRTKDAETCKSMFESSRLQDHEFTEKLNNVLRDCAARPPENPVPDSSRKIKTEKTNKKKEKPISEKKQKLKDYHMHWDDQKITSTKAFSESVVSHTASSAAKCKPSPPKPSCSQRQRPSTIYRPIDSQMDKKPIVKNNSCKYELQLSRESSQPIIVQGFDKKSCQSNKLDSSIMNSGRTDNGNVIQRREGRIPNPSVQSSAHVKEDRPDLLERTSSIKRPEEDDYVTLAEVDLQLSTPFHFMTQSVYGPIIRELANSNHEYENIDLRNFSTNTSIQQSPVSLKYGNSLRDTNVNPSLGKQKRRPISCIAVVDGDQSNKSQSSSNRFSSREPPRNINPKSPYLSQYTKLYSLKMTNGQITYTPQPDPPDPDIMTRSQTSCQYKTPTLLGGKETSGKRSIDSGMVDDLSINFSPENLIRT